MLNHNDDGKMYEIVKIKNCINRIAGGFPEIGPVFNTTSLDLPKLQPSELGFIRVISWLYVHYFEVGKLGCEFIGTQADNAGCNLVRLKNHRTRIQQLRTYCQHNLSYTDTHSKIIQEACETWFKSKSGTHLPGEDAHWLDLLSAIINEAFEYFTDLERILRFIEAHDAYLQIIGQWALRIKRFYPPHRYDVIIEQVASDWGQDKFDAVKFRKRHYDHWRNSFEYRTDEVDFEKEARKIIEGAMLADQQNVLPIDGTDIMEEFSIKPGRAVKEILQIAREIYGAGHCTRASLMLSLKARINSEAK